VRPSVLPGGRPAVARRARFRRQRPERVRAARPEAGEDVGGGGADKPDRAGPAGPEIEQPVAAGEADQAVPPAADGSADQRLPVGRTPTSAIVLHAAHSVRIPYVGGPAARNPQDVAVPAVRGRTCPKLDAGSGRLDDPQDEQDHGKETGPDHKAERSDPGSARFPGPGRVSGAGGPPGRVLTPMPGRTDDRPGRRRPGNPGSVLGSRAAPSASTFASAAVMSSTWMSRWTCWGNAGSGQRGGWWAGACGKLRRVWPSPMST
jgi:hypothetical protein